MRLRAAAAAFLFCSLSAPARATWCDAGGRDKTANQYCKPGHEKYDPRACADRVRDHAEGGCDGRLRDLERKANKSEKDLQEIAAIRTFQQELPEYAKTAAADSGGGVDKKPAQGKAGTSGGGYLRLGGDGAGGEGSGESADGAQGGPLGEAGAAMKNGDFAGAEAAATKAIEANPGDPAAWMARAQARSLLGDKDGARADARRLLTIPSATPKQAEAAEGLIGREGELARAAAKIKGQKLEFGSRSAESLMGGRPGERGDKRGGLDGRSAAGEAPGGGGFQAGADGPAGSARGYDAARAAAAIADLPAARGLKNEAADRAFAKLRVRDYSGAYEDAGRAIAEQPTDARARILRAAAANRLGRHAQAVEDADAALALKPKDVTALLERGYAKYKLGRYTDALADVDSALVEDPLNAMGYLYRGMILEKLTRVSDAVAAYMKAGELDPGLKPVSDEAQARLAPQTGGKPAEAAASLPSRLAARWKLWLALLVVAGVLVARGLRRAVKPEWSTPLTPMR